jgi:hypothetical protein
MPHVPALLAPLVTAAVSRGRLKAHQIIALTKLVWFMSQYRTEFAHAIPAPQEMLDDPISNAR